MSIEVKPAITDNPYEFDVDQNGFPVFTKKNLALLDALLRYDSNYSASEDASDPSTYAGMLDTNGVPTTYDEALAVVKSIDKINSTHLASEGPDGGGRGISLTAEAIASTPDLVDRLRAGDDSLVPEIATAGGKNNFSFATKFCAYTCVFARDIRSDNYCVYDRVLAEVLPYYSFLYSPNELYKSFCRINNRGRVVSDVSSRCKETRDYELYCMLVDNIIDGVKEQSGLWHLPYKAFDQLVWYYFKGDDRKIDRALACIEF